MAQPLCKNSLAVSYTVKHILTAQPSNPAPGYLFTQEKRNKCRFPMLPTKTHLPVFTVALFIITRPGSIPNVAQLGNG